MSTSNVTAEVEGARILAQKLMSKVCTEKRSLKTWLYLMKTLENIQEKLCT